MSDLPVIAVVRVERPLTPVIALVSTIAPIVQIAEIGMLPPRGFPGPPGNSYPEPWTGTQAAYDALSTYDPDRFYIIT